MEAAMSPTSSHTLEMLIHLQRMGAPTPAGSVGLTLAKRLGAWASGLHVVPIAAAAFASPEAIALYVNEADAQYKEALQYAPTWRAQLDAHGIGGDWMVSQGDVIESLCHASRWCDLLVVEQPQINRDAPTGWGVVSRTVFGASAPVMVVPETAQTTQVGERIVIAWNQSRGAMLTIRGALPLLTRAAHVLVLEGDPGENPFDLHYLPKLDLRAWLARRGVNAQFKAFGAPKDPGAALLDAAHAASADLIVMGAWGHSRITELVLGGPTRHLFQHSDLPLLVAH
jgi:nucleotide-binding universal stress UspA family protein